MVPAFALAQSTTSDTSWRDCSADDQCVVIDGTCDKTSVNLQSQRTAEAYYKEAATRAECAPTPFWRRGEMTARCYLGGCQTIVKQAANKP